MIIKIHTFTLILQSYKKFLCICRCRSNSPWRIHIGGEDGDPQTVAGQNNREFATPTRFYLPHWMRNFCCSCPSKIFQFLIAAVHAAAANISLIISVLHCAFFTRLVACSLYLLTFISYRFLHLAEYNLSLVFWALKLQRMRQSCPLFRHSTLKSFSASGCFAPEALTRGSPLEPQWVFLSKPRL